MTNSYRYCCTAAGELCHYFLDEAKVREYLAEIPLKSRVAEFARGACRHPFIRTAWTTIHGWFRHRPHRPWQIDPQ